MSQVRRGVLRRHPVGRSENYLFTKRSLYRESLISIASLPKQIIFAYIYCLMLFFVINVASLPKYFLIFGLFLGVLLVACDETFRLASTSLFLRSRLETAFFVEVGANMDSDILQALQQSTGLPEADIRWMYQVGSKVQILPEAVLIHENKPIDALYFVLSGRFEVSTTGKKRFTLGNLTKNEVRLSFVDSSQVIGEMSFVEEQDYLPSATVKSVSESWVWSIPRSALDEKICSDPLFGTRFFRAISRIIASRLRATNEMRVTSEKKVSKSQIRLDIFRNLFRKNKPSSTSSFTKLPPGLLLFMIDQDLSATP